MRFYEVKVFMIYLIKADVDLVNRTCNFINSELSLGLVKRIEILSSDLKANPYAKIKMDIVEIKELKAWLKDYRKNQTDNDKITESQKITCLIDEINGRFGSSITKF